MKLLLDMNLSPLWISYLQSEGFEAIHWSSIGPPTAPDPEIMEYAAANGLIVFTHDLDFTRLLAIQGKSTPSVVQIRTQDVLPDAIGPIVIRALKASQEYLESGALVTIDHAQHRIRLLPISR